MSNDESVKLLLLRRSQETWADAHAPDGALSERSRIDALFDCAYFALLGLAPRDMRKSVQHHPDVDFIRSACATLNVSAEVGVRFAENQYAPFDDERPSAEQMRAWAVELRGKVV